MKTSSALVFAASLAVAGAQVTNVNGTYHCAIANAAYCAFDSLNGNIIIRCNGNVGFPGNCDDNLAGEPPLGVNYAPCFQTSNVSGDAACAKNCIIYGGSGNYHGTNTILPNCAAQPTTTVSSSSTPTKQITTSTAPSTKPVTTTTPTKQITTSTTPSAKPVTTTTPTKPVIMTTITLTKTVGCSSTSIHSNKTSPTTTKNVTATIHTTSVIKNITTTTSFTKSPAGPSTSATPSEPAVFQGAASRADCANAGFAIVVGVLIMALL